MSLTKEQHDSIMYHYEQKQAHRRRLLEQRRQEVYSAVPEYARLETEIPAAAVSALRRRLNSGDSSSAADLRRQIRDVAARKQHVFKLIAGNAMRTVVDQDLKKKPSCMTSHIFSS